MAHAKTSERSGDILIFAVNLTHLGALQKIFPTSQHRFMLASSENDASEKVGLYHFDLLLFAPIDQSSDACVSLQKITRASKNRDIAILWASPSSLTSIEIENIFELGVADLISKPWVPCQIRTKVDLLIALQHQGDAIEQFEHKIRILAREKLESHDRFNFFMENFDAGALMMVDLDGRIYDWNKGAQRILGFARDDVLGSRVAALYSVNDCA